MNAGQGKSYVAAYLISKIQQKTLIIVPTSSLLTQWTNLLESIFPNLKIGCYWSKRKRDGQIIVIIDKSMLSDCFKFGKKVMIPVDFFKQFGFVIYDEIHKYCAPKVRKIFNNAQATYVLGMSATTNKRPDKLDPIAWYFIGNPIYASSLKGYQKDNHQFSVVINMIKYVGPEEYCQTIIAKKTDSVSSPLMINQICKDPYRKAIVINELEKIYHTGVNAFIFADRREYLTQVATDLYHQIKYSPEGNVIIKIEDIDLSVLLGGGSSTEEDIKTAKYKSQMIFSTFAYLDTGISVTRMTCLFVLTPRRNGWEQKVGRILRLGSDISIPRQVIILCDYNTAIKGQSMAAKNEIKKLYNADVIIRTINYKDIEI